MDADDFRDAVETDRATELDRLGSSKRLVAVTGADLATETVLRSAAESEAAAASVFEEWAADSDGAASEAFEEWAADSDGAASEAFEEWAATEREHYERVAGELGEDVAAEPGAVHDYLREQTDTVTRAGAAVGRGLVAGRTLSQFVGFFVNDADQPRATLFRELKADTESDSAAAADLLASVCERDDEWERAEDAAVGAIDAAYEEYVDALNEMGVDAKSVC